MDSPFSITDLQPHSWKRSDGKNKTWSHWESLRWLFFSRQQEFIDWKKKLQHKKKIIPKTPSTEKNDLNELDSMTGWVYIHFLSCQISLEGVKVHKPKQVAEREFWNKTKSEDGPKSF